jgi:hypothetical protein
MADSNSQGNYLIESWMVSRGVRVASEPSACAIVASMTDPESGDDGDAVGRAKTLLALVFVLALVLGGWILFHFWSEQSQIQDCVMQGRTNCAPINEAP